MCHKIISTPNFEAENVLEIFPLEPYLVSEPRAEAVASDERCLLDEIVHFRIQDESQIVGRSIWQEVVLGQSWVCEGVRGVRRIL